MLVAFSFRAKPGHAAELETLLSDADAARAIAKAMGATRNTLFWRGDRMVRILEFPEGARPVPLAQLARDDPAIRRFLQRVGTLAEPGFDVDAPGDVERFNEAAALRLVYDVRT